MPPGIRAIDLELTRPSPYPLGNGRDAEKVQDLGVTILPGGVVKGKEKLKSVFRDPKNGLKVVHPERVRPGDVKTVVWKEKNRLSKKDCV